MSSLKDVAAAVQKQESMQLKIRLQNTDLNLINDVVYTCFEHLVEENLQHKDLILVRNHCNLHVEDGHKPVSKKSFFGLGVSRGSNKSLDPSFVCNKF